MTKCMDDDEPRLNTSFTALYAYQQLSEMTPLTSLLDASFQLFPQHPP